jgi:non-canonical poly(A) RNA polymerase PAPD5/7
MAAHLLAHPSRRSTGGNNIRRLQGSSSTISTDYAGEGNLGILLVDFFRLYGRALNPSVVGVSCRKGGGFFHKASTSGFNNPERSYLFAVEDPNDATNDLGRNSHNISRVRMAFDYAYCQLIAPSKQGTSLLKRIIRLDPVLFARDPSSHAIIEAPEGGGGGEGVKKRRRE